jgi:transcriptional regulator with XRE-family HTH domain
VRWSETKWPVTTRRIQHRQPSSMPPSPMTASRAREARLALGLSEAALAVESNTTPAVVQAWEAGRMNVPPRVALDLAWRIARHERLAALESSGLPECEWVKAFATEPVPDKLDAKRRHFERLLEHRPTCGACTAREAFISERFPPMPPAPRRGIMILIMPIGDRIQRLPAWARPAAVGALLFVAYSFVRLLFLLPAIARDPWQGGITAVEGILASAAIGAVLGALYGLYRRWRARGPKRRMA